MQSTVTVRNYQFSITYS